MVDYIVQAAKNTGYIFENTLKSFGIVDTVAAGNIIAAGANTYAETQGLTQKLDGGAKVKVTTKIAPKAGGALLTVGIELAKDPNHDGYRAVVTGVGSTLVVEGVATAAEALGTAMATAAGASGVSVGALIIVDALATLAIGALASTYLGQGYDYFITQEFRSKFNENTNLYDVTTKWNLRDSLNPTLFSTIDQYIDSDIDNLWSIVKKGQGNGFKLFLDGQKEYSLVYNKTTKTYKYPGSIAQIKTKDAGHAKTDMDYMVNFLKSVDQIPDNHFHVQFNSNQTYDVYAYGFMDKDTIVSSARNNKYAFNALINLEKYYIDNDPTVTISDVPINVLSDTYLGKRAEFLKRVADDNTDTYNSYSPYSYYENDLNLQSIGGGSVTVNFGDTNYRISNKVATYLFGSITGDKNDLIKGSYDNNAKDYVEGLDGSDTIYTYDGDDTIYTNANISSQYDHETASTLNRVYAGDGDDTIIGSKGTDIIYSGDDNDTIYVTSQTDHSSLAKDYVEGGLGADKIYGSNGDNIIYGDTTDEDNGSAFKDNDTIYGYGGKDTIYGGVDEDVVYGGSGNDTLIGGEGGDTLIGGSDNDTLYSTTANDSDDNNKDILNGGVGDDTLYGGSGYDELIGGKDYDIYYASNGNIIKDDTDAEGEVHFKGHKLGQAKITQKEGEENSYSDGVFDYYLGGDTLKVVHIDIKEYIWIKNFDSKKDDAGSNLTDIKNMHINNIRYRRMDVA